MIAWSKTGNHIRASLSRYMREFGKGEFFTIFCFQILEANNSLDKSPITSEKVAADLSVNSEKGRLPPELFAEVKNLKTSQKFHSSPYVSTTCRKLDQISFTKIN